MISFSLLKVETTTPENRFIMRKLLRMMKNMKKKAQYMFSLTFGYLSMPTESMPLFITSIQPSVVDIWKSEKIAFGTLSKF